MSRTARRGQPLMMLVGVALGWAMLRVTFWETPFHVVDAPTSQVAAPALPHGGAAVRPMAAAIRNATRAMPSETSGYLAPRPLPAPLSPFPVPSGKYLARDPAKVGDPALLTSAPAPVPVPVPVRVSVGHNLLLMAGLAQMEVPPVLLAYLQPAQARPVVHPTAAARVANRAMARWSADGWVMLRQGATGPLLSGQPSYGRSQAGAVVRYRLAPQSAFQPQAYLRGALALSGVRDREMAAGLSARPLARVPLRLQAELRVADTAAGAKVRPAALVVSELPVLPLPLGARAEGYVQAGYVGGDYATGF
ncbi:MAG: hypothetical protein WA842_07020, partial [Croceibacterium sp.]